MKFTLAIAALALLLTSCEGAGAFLSGKTVSLSTDKDGKVSGAITFSK